MERILDVATKEELVLRATTTWNNLHTQTREVVAKVPLFVWLDVRTLKMVCLSIGIWFSVSITFLALLVHVFPQREENPDCKDPFDKEFVIKGRVTPLTNRSRLGSLSPRPYNEDVSSVVSSPTDSPRLRPVSPAGPLPEGGPQNTDTPRNKLPGTPGIARRLAYSRPSSPSVTPKPSLARSDSRADSTRSAAPSRALTPTPVGKGTALVPSSSLAAFQAAPRVKATFATTEELSPGVSPSQDVKIVVTPSEVPSFIPVETEPSRPVTPTRLSSFTKRNPSYISRPGNARGY